jgi:uncharacterized iron-regulated protein
LCLCRSNFRTLLIALAIIIGSSTTSFKEVPAYQVFNQKGKATDFEKLCEAAADADVICFGELHNNSMGHWLQLRLLKYLAAKKANKVVVGAEMWEADDQIVLTEFAQGKITEKHLETEAKLWPNYALDYKPFFKFAWDNKIPVIATNIPRRYASMVMKKGMDSIAALPAEAKAWIAPLPVTFDLTLPGYKALTEGMGGHGGPMSENFAKSQAIKDATMAHFISKNLKPGVPFLHLNGSYHSNNFEGIVHYLLKGNNKLKVLTINMVEQENLEQLATENQGTATFIIAIPSDMHHSY